MLTNLHSCSNVAFMQILLIIAIYIIVYYELISFTGVSQWKGLHSGCCTPQQPLDSCGTNLWTISFWRMQAEN